MKTLLEILADDHYADRGSQVLSEALDIDETATRFSFNVRAAQALRTGVHQNRYAIALLGCFFNRRWFASRYKWLSWCALEQT